MPTASIHLDMHSGSILTGQGCRIVSNHSSFITVCILTRYKPHYFATQDLSSKLCCGSPRSLYTHLRYKALK